MTPEEKAAITEFEKFYRQLLNISRECKLLVSNYKVRVYYQSSLPML